MSMRISFTRSLAVLALLALPVAGSAVEIDSNTFGGLEARAIGPAVMSGRIAAIDAIGPDPLTIYIGTASGGVWKSDDAGTTFEPVFDEQPQSIGAVAIDRSDKETVWVGTGETWTRNSVSVGRGLYKTTDGGDNWKLVGLGDSERIAAIRIHPEDSDTVWVCATGHLWSSGGERGVYKTTDGGESWERVLFVDEDTGCSDLDFDPQNPDILYAGMWQFRRSPDFFSSGGPGSGLYKSTDGGETWSELTEGLPAGEKGRIAVAVAPSRTSRVYALVEADQTALYRSDDLGASWQEVDSSFNVTARPFYFAVLEVDPLDYERLYKPGLSLSVSTDGGESLTSPFTGGFGGGVHSDLHALWINPDNPYELLLGTDGGVYMSNDRANTWRHIVSLPVSQFYRVSVDDAYPYYVYGGLQDNGSWRGPSRSPGGIENRDWENIGFGDGFWAYRDPLDPDYVYAEYQGGNLMRRRLSTGEVRDIKPQPGEGEPDYRYNWNTPVYLSPNKPGRLYIGSQFLLRSDDQGASWERISPDLTTNNPELQRQEESGGLTIDNSTAENHTTIYAISESPLDEQVLWVGTDDGNLQLTRDGGESWTNVVGNVPDLPAGTWVSFVEASRHDPATAFATFDGHRSGDMATYLYKTTDYGASWQSLVSDDLEGYAYVVRQDLEQPQLLFLGTEFGLFISIDGGEQWARFTGNLPPVSVQHMVIHPREGDLVLATHGRGIYILDDLTPLRALTAEVLDSDVALLPSRPAVLYTSADEQRYDGDAQYIGFNPPEAASIVYYMKRRHLFGDLKVEVYDADGELITTLPASKRRGLNRVSWPMRLPPPKVPPASSLAPAFVGPRLPEGTYTVKLIKGDETRTGQVQLVADPRSPHSPEDRALQQSLSLRLYDLLEQLTYLVETSIDARDALRQRAEAANGRQRRELEELADDLDAFRSGLVATSEAGWLSGEEKLREKLAELYSGVTSYEGRPTQTQLDRSDKLQGQLEEAVRRFDGLKQELAEVNRTLQRRGQEPVALPSMEEWKAEQEAH